MARSPTAGMFERRSKYRIPVWMSRHPDLNSYISKVLVGIRPRFLDRTARQVVVALIGPSHTAVERFVFQFQEPSLRPPLRPAPRLNDAQSPAVSHPPAATRRTHARTQLHARKWRVRACVPVCHARNTSPPPFSAQSPDITL